MNKVYFGIAGWSYKDWDGIVYPSKKGKGFNSLEYIIRQIDTIEINSTFYRIPPSPYVENWCRIAKTRENFLFTIKLFQDFSHAPENINSEITKEFKKILDIFMLNNLLGALLIQFPWFYAYTDKNISYVKKIANEFIDYHPCIEIRHISWDKKEVLETFSSNNIGFVNIDQPPSKSGMPPRDYVTSDVGYVRLHGRNSVAWFNKDSTRDQKYDYNYQTSEISEWVDRIRNIASVAKITFVVANNHYKGSAFFNIKEMKKRFDAPKCFSWFIFLLHYLNVFVNIMV